MEEGRSLPKNIRQIGEKEENLRIYLEDFVYTFIQKLGADGENKAGILLGNRETVEGKRCWFINGAVELEGLLGENGVCFSEEMWKTAEEETGRYFSDCSICGWFIRGGDLAFPDREMLKKVHSQVFAGENCLMYWKEEENDCFWIEADKQLKRLKGYYVYYERNFQMQNYMLSCQERPVSEAVDDQAAQNFRKIMKSKKKQKKSAQAVWMQGATVAAAAVIFVGSIYLIGKMTSGNTSDDQVPALAVGASVERRSSGVKEAQTVSQEESREAQTREESRPEEVNAAEGKTEKERDTTEGEEETELPALRLYMEEENGSFTAFDSAEKSEAEKTFSPSEESGEQTGIQDSDPAREAGASVTDRKYTIQPGDTLADISIRFYGSTEMIMKICEVNDISNPNTIFIGQEIELP